jgi:hypothetical protein
VLAAFAIAALFALGLATVEIYLRATGAHPLQAIVYLRGMFEADGDGHVRTVAGFRSEMTVAGRTVAVRLNGLGGRGGDVGPKTPGERRLLCLGDSMVFGHGVAEEEALPAVLEDLLRAAGGAVAVGNAGVPSFGPVQHERVLARWREPFAPDAVLLFVYIGNDFEDNLAARRSVVDGFFMPTPVADFVRSSWRARLALHSYTAMTVEQFLIHRHLPLALPIPHEAAGRELLAAAAALPPTPELRFAGLFMDAVEETPPLRAAMDAMVEACARVAAAAAPARTAAVILPTAWHVLPGVYAAELERTGRAGGGFAAGTCQTRLVERLGARGVRAVDLTVPLRERADVESLFIPGDRHFSPAGHRFAARFLLPLARELLGG